MSYEVTIKPLVGRVAHAFNEWTKRRLKPDVKRSRLRLLDHEIRAAVKAGATIRDLTKAVGGPKNWNKLARAMKRGGLVG